jgi:hypothetical protein
LSEAIRIVNESDDLPASLCRDLSEAWNNFINDLPSLIAFQDSEHYMVSALETNVAQTKAQEGEKQ